MRALLDTGVWFRRFHGLPLPRSMETILDTGVTDFCLSTISILEIVYKWRHGRLPCPPPEEWMEEATADFRVLPVTGQIALRAGTWDWDHGDPADRLITATAACHEVTLIHTDLQLKGLKGFPQQFFRGTN
jgi:PIN domain nuclease of toxin-antitoxin system